MNIPLPPMKLCLTILYIPKRVTFWVCNPRQVYSFEPQFPHKIGIKNLAHDICSQVWTNKTDFLSVLEHQLWGFLFQSNFIIKHQALLATETLLRSEQVLGLSREAGGHSTGVLSGSWCKWGVQGWGAAKETGILLTLADLMSDRTGHHSFPCWILFFSVKWITSFSQKVNTVFSMFL